MTPKKELQIAYGMGIILLIVGFLSYAAFPAKSPDKPVRLMYKTVAGKVLFDHKTHTLDSGYGISCGECHHHPEGDEEAALRACGDCHQTPKKDAAIPQSCTECHESDEVEDMEMSKRSDAFHSQCESCHQDSGAGPVDKDKRCDWCHVKTS